MAVSSGKTGPAGGTPAPVPAGARVAIVVARWNESFTAGMLAAARATLSAGGPSASFASATGANANARVTALENDFIKVRFTDYGGALSDVALKKFPAIDEPSFTKTVEDFCRKP